MVNDVADDPNKSIADEASELIKLNGLTCDGIGRFRFEYSLKWCFFNLILCIIPFFVSFLLNMDWIKSLDFQRSWLAFIFTTMVTSIYAYHCAGSVQRVCRFVRFVWWIAAIWTIVVCIIFTIYNWIDVRIKTFIVDGGYDYYGWAFVLLVTMILSLVLNLPSMDASYLKMVQTLVARKFQKEKGDADSVSEEAYQYADDLTNSLEAEAEKYI